MNDCFWRDKRVLVTGHTGFKGSWLCLWLQSLGSNVQGIALPPQTEPSLYHIAGVARGMGSRLIDLRDLGRVVTCFQEFRPEIVLHLAAQPLVRFSYSNPIETYATNVMGCLHLLEAARRCESTKAVLVVTTDKCYENREWAWGYRESDQLGGHDPYSSSKACVEILCNSYRTSFLASSGISIATARAGNVIGGGDWSPDRLVPDIIRALERSEPIEIRNPDAIRPWQHVLDPLAGYLLLAERLYTDGECYAESWNFGPAETESSSVRSITERICSIWGRGSSWVPQSGLKPYESQSLRLNTSKAIQRLLWKPRWDVETALNYTVEWHKALSRGEEMHAVCMQQLGIFHRHESFNRNRPASPSCVTGLV